MISHRLIVLYHTAHYRSISYDIREINVVNTDSVADKLLLIKTRLIEDYNFALDTSSRAICAPSLAYFSVEITSPHTPRLALCSLVLVLVPLLAGTEQNIRDNYQGRLPAPLYNSAVGECGSVLSSRLSAAELVSDCRCG